MSQMYNVAVPQGYGPGMQFQAQVGGQMQLITVPQGAGPGSVVQVAGPPLVAQATPVPQAQPQVAYAQPIGQQQPAYGYGQQQPPPPQPMGMTGYGQASPEQPPPYPVAPQAKQQMANQPKGVPPPVFLQPTHALQLPKKLERLYLGLGWRSARQGLDLDASAIIFSRGQKIDTVNFQKLRNVAQGNASIVHTGDVLTGQQSPGKMEDLERIYFWCARAPCAPAECARPARQRCCRQRARAGSSAPPSSPAVHRARSLPAAPAPHALTPPGPPHAPHAPATDRARRPPRRAGCPSSSAWTWSTWS